MILSYILTLGYLWAQIEKGEEFHFFVQDIFWGYLSKRLHLHLFHPLSHLFAIISDQ